MRNMFGDKNCKKEALKKITRMTIMLIVMSMLIGSFPVKYVNAKTKIRLNKTHITLEVGEKTKLKILGTQKKVTWSSLNKSIATVSAKGEVYAKKKGVTIITAKIGQSKYKCVVTIKAVSYEKQMERYYNLACKRLADEKYDEAIKYFNLAKGYKDSKSRLKECYYKKGALLFAKEQYESAADYFRKAGKYLDSATKELESYYNLACKRFEDEKYEEAIKYFNLAKGYKDSKDRIKESYYKQGVLLFEEEEYMLAADCFKNAGNYSDSAMQELECYYVYGNILMERGKNSSAISVLELCMGYKDTDDILNAYYYEKASKMYSKYIDALAQGNNYEISDYYEKTIGFLTKCEGYKDSTVMMEVCVKLQEVKTYYQNVSANVYGVFSLKGISVAVEGDDMKISIPEYTVDAAVVCSMDVAYNFKRNTFSVVIENMYAGESVLSKKNVKMVESLLTLFAEITDLDDFMSEYADRDNWCIADNTADYSARYEGCDIDVHVSANNSRLKWVILLER